MNPEERLVTEFKKLAAEARANERESEAYDKEQAMRWRSREEIYRVAARMVEKELLGR